jgi:hypothetical protein
MGNTYKVLTDVAGNVKNLLNLTFILLVPVNLFVF